MASLKEVRGRIKSVMSTQQITKAMKMVAAAKLRRAQDNIISMRPYAKRLQLIIDNLKSGIESSDNLYEKAREVKSVLMIVITSDRGLCGAFNSNVNKAAYTFLSDQYSEQLNKGSVKVLSIGKKGGEYFSKRNVEVIGQFTPLFTRLNFLNSKDVSEFATRAFLNGEFDAVYVTFNEFKNVATQIVQTQQLLPLIKSDSLESHSGTDYILEPEKVQIYEELIPKALNIALYKAVLESNASEHGARMTAMDKATENAGDLLKELKLTYNRTRQAAITKEILEIVGGAEALSGG